MTSNAKKYWAFISYSSKDRKWGQWLHKRLENYPIPPEFRGYKIFDGDTLGKNLRPVFRDRDELAGSSDLGPAIMKALQDSRFLIVLCSLNSGKSEWVNKEIQDFKALDPENEKRILALILDGEPNASSNDNITDEQECFPPALQYPSEPLAGDLRRDGDGKERGFLKILSGISQIGFDELYRRHERAQRKKRLVLSLASTLIIAALTGLSIFAFRQKNEAQEQKQVAETSNKRNIALLEKASINEWALASESYREMRLDEAIARCANGLKNDPNNLGLIHFSLSLLEQRKIRPLKYTYALEFPCVYAGFTDDPKQLITIENVYSKLLSIKLWHCSQFKILDKSHVPLAAQALDGPVEIPRGEKSKTKPWMRFIPSTVKRLVHPTTEEAFTFRFSDKVYSVYPDSISYHPRDAQYYVHTIPMPTAGTRPVNLSVSEKQFLISYGSTGVAESHPATIFIFQEDEHSASYLQRTQQTPHEKAPAQDQFSVMELSEIKDILLPQPAQMALSNASQVILFSPTNETPPAYGEDAVPVETVIRIYDSESNAVIAESSPVLFEHWNPYTLAIARHPDKNLYAIQGDHSLSTWDIDTNVYRTNSNIKNQGPGWTGSVWFSHDGKVIYSGLGRCIHVSSSDSLSPVRNPIFAPSIVNAIRDNKYVERILTSYGHGDGAGSGGYAQLWHSQTLNKIGPQIELASQIEQAAFISRGNAFLLSSTAPEGCEIQIWDSLTALPRSVILTYDHDQEGQVFMAFSHYASGESSTLWAHEDNTGYLKKSLVTPQSAAPSWYYSEFLPLISSREIDATGRVRIIPAKELGDRSDKLPTSLNSDQSIYGRFANAFLQTQARGE